MHKFPKLTYDGATIKIIVTHGYGCVRACVCVCVCVCACVCARALQSSQ